MIYNNILNEHGTGAHPIHKATLVPRGHALGMVQQLADDDQLMYSREELLAGLDVAMGGRAAEELIFGPSKVFIVILCYIMCFTYLL